MTSADPIVDSGTTLSLTIGRGEQTEHGYRTLASGPGEPYRVRRDLGGVRPDRLQPLACFVQLSDLHVTDAQSPARAEYLDRFGDADSPLADSLGRIGMYRAQQALTAHVVSAMTQSVSRMERGPLTGMPFEFAFSTGDATDNCQANELETYLALLDGDNYVTIDSGEPGHFQGVGAQELFDPRYWHPEGSPAGEEIDIPRRVYGFPLVPGLLDGALRPFIAVGLPIPWYTVYGNHDALFSGTLDQNEALVAVALGGQKPIGLGEGADPLSILSNNATKTSSDLWGLLSAPTRSVTADPDRHPVSAERWIARHLQSPGSPVGHGLADAPFGRCYYGFDVGIVRFLVLDTVNPAGGWQGSIDDEQFQWLEEELLAGTSTFIDRSERRVTHRANDRLFVLVSHHPLETLINGFAPHGGVRHLEPVVRALLERFPNVVCWINGHTHCNTIRPIPSSTSGTHSGFWQITTASHIDWPQQSRIVELAVDASSGDIVIGTAMIDHLGLIEPRSGSIDDELTIAGWSRELAANAWQGRINGEPVGRGNLLDRNTLLVLPSPFDLSR